MMTDPLPPNAQTSEDKLRRIFDAVADDLLNASFHNQLRTELREAVGENDRAMNQAPAFWGLVIKSQADSTMSNLCRAYDQHKDSVNLKYLLKNIEANLELFGEERLFERLRGREFAEELSKTARKPDRHQLLEDKLRVCKCNPLVKKLIGYRDETLAHRDKSVFLRGEDSPDPLTWDEVGQLVKAGLDLVNSYSQLYQKSTWQRRLHGDDDYKSVLTAINRDLDNWDREIEDEIRNDAHS